MDKNSPEWVAGYEACREQVLKLCAASKDRMAFLGAQKTDAEKRFYFFGAADEAQSMADNIAEFTPETKP